MTATTEKRRDTNANVKLRAFCRLFIVNSPDCIGRTRQKNGQSAETCKLHPSWECRKNSSPAERFISLPTESDRTERRRLKQRVSPREVDARSGLGTIHSGLAGYSGRRLHRGTSPPFSAPTVGWNVAAAEFAARGCGRW